jgi:hypothetical protein
MDGMAFLACGMSVWLEVSHFSVYVLKIGEQLFLYYI